MTYTIYALEKTRAALCVGRTVTDNVVVKELVAAHYQGLGYTVKIDIEE